MTHILPNLMFAIAQWRCSIIKFIFKVSNGKIDDLSLVYNTSYFRQLRKVEESSAVEVVKVLFNHFHPKTVVDLGCGVGIYLKIFQGLDIDILGYDGSKAAQKQFCCHSNYFKLADLRQPIYPSAFFDLCICFEVAEHIEEKYVDTFLNNVITFSNTVAFTSADIYKKGIGHVNLKPSNNWISLFSDRQFYYDQDSTFKLRSEMKQKKVIEWLPNNLMVFRKRL